MNTLGEIESAIERLTPAEMAELAAWLEQFCGRQVMRANNDTWLECARGAARPGVTTEGVLALTRGEE